MPATIDAGDLAVALALLTEKMSALGMNELHERLKEPGTPDGSTEG